MLKALAGLIAVLSFPFECLFKIRFSPRTQTAILRLDQIGDFILSRGFIRGVLEKFPETLIIVNQSVLPIAQQYFPDANLLGVSLKGFRFNPIYRFRILLTIYQIGIQKIIHPVFSRHHFIADAESIIRASGASIVMGFHGELLDGLRSLITSTLSNKYTHDVSTATQLHDSQKYRDLARLLDSIDYGLYDISIPAPPTFQFKRPYVVLFPFANSQQRQWPVAEWIVLISHLIDWNMEIVICGDHKVADPGLLTRHFGDRVVNLIGKTSVEAVLNLVGHAEWVCGVDGGGVHIAAAYNKRTLAIVGGGHWGRFFPYPPGSEQVVAINHTLQCYGCRWACIYKSDHSPCVSHISAQSVVKRLEHWRI